MVHGRPMTLAKDMITHFVNHRHEVVIRRTKFELAEAEKELISLRVFVAIDHLDEVIQLIRSSKNPDEREPVNGEI